MAKTTTVRLSTSANRKLGRLQARLRARSGLPATKRSTLERLIDQAIEEEGPILLPAPRYPLPESVIRKLKDYPRDWGVRTSERDIDRILYGATDGYGD